MRNGGLVIYPTDTVYGIGCDITNSRALERLASELEIQAVIKVDDNFAKTLDTLCQQIENRIDYSLAELVDSCTYNSTEIIFLEEQENVLAIAKMTYQVEYMKEEPVLPADDEANLDQFHVDYDMADPNDGSVTGPDGQIDATDIVDV